MDKYRCILRVKDKNGGIVGYRLEDSKGNEVYVESKLLKNSIKSKRVIVSNLMLTSDDRLIVVKDRWDQDSTKIKYIFRRMKSLGCKIDIGHDAVNRSEYYIGHINNGKHIVYIPDDVESIVYSGINQLNSLISDLNGTVIIHGGRGLTDTSRMFNGCKASEIDIRKLDTSNVTNMSSMFEDINVSKLDISGLVTDNVKDMSNMFAICKAGAVIWCKFNTGNVMKMPYMFYRSSVGDIDLSNIDTSNVRDMRWMFGECESHRIKLSNISTEKVINMRSMFYSCKLDELDLSSFNTSNVVNMSSMFQDCEIAGDLDISNFEMGQIKDVNRMFDTFRSRRLNLGAFDVNHIEDVPHKFKIVYRCNVSEVITSNNEVKKLFN